MPHPDVIWTQGRLQPGHVSSPSQGHMLENRSNLKIQTRLFLLCNRLGQCWYWKHEKPSLKSKAALVLTSLPVSAQSVLAAAAAAANVQLSFMLILTRLPLFQSIALCLSLQAAERDEPTDLFCQWQWQRQGQRCRRQQDRDQPGHTSVPDGTQRVCEHKTESDEKGGDVHYESVKNCSWQFSCFMNVVCSVNWCTGSKWEVNWNMLAPVMDGWPH